MNQGRTPTNNLVPAPTVEGQTQEGEHETWLNRCETSRARSGSTRRSSSCARTPTKTASQLVNTRVRGVIEQMGGKLLKVDNWGKRKLAYEVKKQLKGIYLYWQYLGTPGVVEEIERNLRMLDSVIRYYTVKVDENVDPTARPPAIDEETFNKAATTVPTRKSWPPARRRLPRFEDEDDARPRRRLPAGARRRPADHEGEGISHDADGYGRAASGAWRARRQGRRQGKERASAASRAARCAASAPTRTSAIDYKDPQTLKYFITDRGKIVPRRITRQLREAPAQDRRRRSSARA